MLLKVVQIVFFYLVSNQQEGRDKTQNIHHSVPADMQWSEMKKKRIYLRVRKHYSVDYLKYLDWVFSNSKVIFEALS